MFRECPVRRAISRTLTPCRFNIRISITPSTRTTGPSGKELHTNQVAQFSTGGVAQFSTGGDKWRYVPKDLPPKSTLYDYCDLWTDHRVIDRIHHALYVKCREKLEREATPTACIIDSQSVKSAEKGGPALIRLGSMQAKRSKARNGTSWSIPKAC